jgi:hypothetical protein
MQRRVDEEGVDSVNSTLEVARDYLARGWQPIPIEPQGKKPVDENGKPWKDWDKHTIDAGNVEKYFALPDLNIGVRLGQKSGVVDVDLDCGEARQLAEPFLPTTGAIFGRKSSPKSHWLYRTEVFGDKGALRYGDKDEGTLIELRSGGGDEGAQPYSPDQFIRAARGSNGSHATLSPQRSNMPTWRRRLRRSPLDPC